MEQEVTNLYDSNLHKELLLQYKKVYSLLSSDKNRVKNKALKDNLKSRFIGKSAEETQNIMNTLLLQMKTAVIAIDEIGLKEASVYAILLYPSVERSIGTLEQDVAIFGEEVEIILRGLLKVHEFDCNKSAIESENFIKLLLSFAEDIRVIFIMIAQRLQLMRDAKKVSDKRRLDLSVEAIYLYAPLAHRLGLYSIKSELEDLSLKYTDRATYDFVADKLNESKTSRAQYIETFIKPIEEKLKLTGLKFDIKGRTKSIHSINNKLKKQKIEFENIYDLFAIRVILDSPLSDEKAHCWQVYSIITDMYQPNPKRLKDWLSIPKTNGYESLHITVMGPESKWVEVQIRTKRMDEIAERGLAAHWKYKGVKSEQSLDEWVQSVRESLENKEARIEDRLGDFKLNLYEEEIFVFTPKGDLYKLPQNASLLDFAFAIHTRLGSTCVSGRVNGRNVPLKHKLKSGDQVEIISSPNQSPRQDWLSFVSTSKARSRIRQYLKEEANKESEIAKEMFYRRMKNRKIEVDESTLMRLFKKLKYKNITDFFADIAREKLEINSVIDLYIDIERKESESDNIPAEISADAFTLHPVEEGTRSVDELIIDQNLTGIDYKLAKCCNPIFGDDIFGFVSSQGIKIHRTGCPNAHNMFSRFGYRILPARWSAKSLSGYVATLRIVGRDQIQIVSNIISLVSKEDGVEMRSINIDSNDGLFQGNLSVLLSDTLALDKLIKKMRSVKGVKQVERFI